MKPKFEIGQCFQFYTNLGISIGMIAEITEKQNIVYTGWLENGEGTFEIIQTPEHLAGSIHWSTKVMRNKSINASYIEKVVKL